MGMRLLFIISKDLHLSAGKLGEEGKTLKDEVAHPISKKYQLYKE